MSIERSISERIPRFRSRQRRDNLSNPSISPAMADDISINGTINGKDKKKHSVEIKVKKGKKDEEGKRRKSDQIHIKVDGTDITEAIIQQSEGHKEDDSKKKIKIRWKASEKNGYGGSTGTAESFAIQVHCPEEKGEKDTPHIIIQISAGTRKKLKEAKEFAENSKTAEMAKEIAKAFGFPDGFPQWLLDLAEGGEFRIEITIEEQKKLNGYLDDPELPRELY
jgi:uncharacterized OsmC-like protein